MQILATQKGYGFVRFGNDNEKSLALSEMNGVFCSGRPMQMGPAILRKSSGVFQLYKTTIQSNPQ